MRITIPQLAMHFTVTINMHDIIVPFDMKGCICHFLKWADTLPSKHSWAGRRGYRAPPGNQFLIDVSRLEKYQRKRFAMLKSWQNVPHTIFMQISDAITRKCILRHISANSAHSSTIKVSYPMFWGSKSIINLFLKWSDVSNIMLLRKMLPPLTKSLFFAIAQPILKITAGVDLSAGPLARDQWKYGRASQFHFWLVRLASW